MKNKILDALYHIRKEQAVQSYCLNPEGSLFNSDTIYALANDCFPYFSPRSAEFKEYEDVFRVKRRLSIKFGITSAPSAIKKGFIPIMSWKLDLVGKTIESN